MPMLTCDDDPKLPPAELHSSILNVLAAITFHWMTSIWHRLQQAAQPTRADHPEGPHQRKRRPTPASHRIAYVPFLLPSYRPHLRLQRDVSVTRQMVEESGACPLSVN